MDLVVYIPVGIGILTGILIVVAGILYMRYSALTKGFNLGWDAAYAQMEREKEEQQMMEEPTLTTTAHQVAGVAVNVPLPPSTPSAAPASPGIADSGCNCINCVTRRSAGAGRHGAVAINMPTMTLPTPAVPGETTGEMPRPRQPRHDETVKPGDDT